MSKNFHHLTIPQCAWLCILCLLVLANAGCQRRQNADIAGVSIPIPANMTKNPDKSFVPIKGFEDGQVSYEGKVAPAEIFTFYQEVMEADGWKPNSWFAGQKDQIAYTKGNRGSFDLLHSDSQRDYCFDHHGRHPISAEIKG